MGGAAVTDAAVQADEGSVVESEQEFRPSVAVPEASSDESTFSLAGAAPDAGIEARGMAAPSFDHLAPPPDPVECEPLPAVNGIAFEAAQVVEDSSTASVALVEEMVTAPAVDPVITAAMPTPVSAPPQSVPDYEAHYTLGVAYKNMGLYDDALDEFHVAKASDSFYLDSCLMTALCMKDQRQYRQAIGGLESVLSDPRCQGAKG